MTVIENSIYRGESTELTVTVEVEGEPVDISSGAYLVSQMRYTLRSGALASDAAAAITKTLASGIVLAAQSGDTLGQAVITISSADTAALTPGLYYEQVAVEFSTAPGQWRYVVEPQRRVVYGSVEALPLP